MVFQDLMNGKRRQFVQTHMVGVIINWYVWCCSIYDCSVDCYTIRESKQLAGMSGYYYLSLEDDMVRQLQYFLRFAFPRIGPVHEFLLFLSAKASFS